MATNLGDVIAEKAQALTEEQQREVLGFIEVLERQPAPIDRLGKLIDDCFKDVPPEEINRLPTDGSLNLDHYLYGVPKK